jgi:hypothetical protein
MVHVARQLLLDHQQIQRKESVKKKERKMPLRLPLRILVWTRLSPPRLHPPSLL